jgi:hypothetical protein
MALEEFEDLRIEVSSGRRHCAFTSERRTDCGEVDESASEATDVATQRPISDTRLRRASVR